MWVLNLWTSLQHDLGELEAEGSSGKEKGAVQAAFSAPSRLERVVSSAVRCP